MNRLIQLIKNEFIQGYVVGSIPSGYPTNYVPKCGNT